MGERAEACRRKSAECERAAAAATDVDTRTMYLGMARQRRQMAELDELFERRLA
jgi:hypothetical protein